MARPGVTAGALVGSLLVLPAVAASDTASGVAAYEAGDFAEALALLDPEAQSGDTEAQFYLGQIHADGPDDLKDLEAAIEWYRQAAEAGHAEAQFQLGMRQSVGLGTERDLIEAYKWLRLAEEGLATAAPTTFLQTFAGQMSAEDVTAAEAAVEQWRLANTQIAGREPQTATPVPAPAAPTVDAVGQLIAAYDCADLIADAGPDGDLRVAGVVRDDDDVAAFLKDIEATFGPDTVQAALDPVGAPNCAVAAFIGGHRPDDALLSADKSVFEEGDMIVVDITTNDVAHYLYVDYFAQDGTVIHLLPEAVNGPSRIEPGHALRLGDGSTSDFVWRAAPPFGRELLAVFMSDAPLFDGLRPVEEQTEDYLPRLRAQTVAQSGGVIADYLTITTAPGAP